MSTQVEQEIWFTYGELFVMKCCDIFQSDNSLQTNTRPLRRNNMSSLWLIERDERCGIFPCVSSVYEEVMCIINDVQKSLQGSHAVSYFSWSIVDVFLGTSPSNYSTQKYT